MAPHTKWLQCVQKTREQYPNLSYKEVVKKASRLYQREKQKQKQKNKKSRKSSCRTTPQREKQKISHVHKKDKKSRKSSCRTPPSRCSECGARTPKVVIVGEYTYE